MEIKIGELLQYSLTNEAKQAPELHLPSLHQNTRSALELALNPPFPTIHNLPTPKANAT